MSATLQRELEPHRHTEYACLPTTLPGAKPGKVNTKWFTLIAAVILTLSASAFAFALVQKYVLASPSLPALAALETPALAKLALPANLQAERKLGFLNVSGEVVNQAGNPLSHVEAVVELMDSAGRVVQTSSALIEFDPLPARGRSGFNISLPDSPNASSYRVQFREMLGRNLN